MSLLPPLLLESPGCRELRGVASWAWSWSVARDRWRLSRLGHRGGGEGGGERPARWGKAELPTLAPAPSRDLGVQTLLLPLPAMWHWTGHSSTGWASLRDSASPPLPPLLPTHCHHHHRGWLLRTSARAGGASDVSASDSAPSLLTPVLASGS